MTNKPFALTDAEIKEIASMKEIQDLWGAVDAAEMEHTLSYSYTVKFDFMNGSPGYYGDLFMLQGDSLDSEAQPIRLVRNREKKLEIFN